MPAFEPAEPRPAQFPVRPDSPSWPERVAEVLRRIFLPGEAPPEFRPAPVIVRAPRGRRRT